MRRIQEHVGKLMAYVLAHETSADGFPFVGALPNRSNQFINAGYTGHGTSLFLLRYLTKDISLTCSSKECLASCYLQHPWRRLC